MSAARPPSVMPKITPKVTTSSAAPSPVRRVRVLYFAACRDKTGTAKEELVIDAAHAKVIDVVAHVRILHPALTDVLARCRVAVNQAFAQPNDDVPDGAELALIPPVAGG
jgi:molybdopterin synthase catalytic subunit